MTDAEVIKLVGGLLGGGITLLLAVWGLLKYTGALAIREARANIDLRIASIEGRISTMEAEVKEMESHILEAGREAAAGRSRIHARLDSLPTEFIPRAEMREALRRLDDLFAALKDDLGEIKRGQAALMERLPAKS